MAGPSAAASSKKSRTEEPYRDDPEATAAGDDNNDNGNNDASNNTPAEEEKDVESAPLLPSAENASSSSSSSTKIAKAIFILTTLALSFSALTLILDIAAGIAIAATPNFYISYATQTGLVAITAPVSGHFSFSSSLLSAVLRTHTLTLAWALIMLSNALPLPLRLSSLPFPNSALPFFYFLISPSLTSLSFPQLSSSIPAPSFSHTQKG